jgi:type IV secretion system protein VirB1
MIDAALFACAPAVAPATLSAIIQVESGAYPYAINVNRLPGAAKAPRVARPRDAASAAQAARAWIAKGHSVDLGLMQVNSRNLARLGFTIEQMFDPCTNIKAGASILIANYKVAVRTHGEGQRALGDALSAYNTGSYYRGYNNGYVGKYFNLAGANVGDGASAHSVIPPAPSPYLAETAVYSRKETEYAVSNPDASAGDDAGVLQ